jgi:hypothetical protein
MKNVTITLPDHLAREARVEAARQGKSLSRWIAERLAGELASKNGSLDAFEQTTAQLPAERTSAVGGLPAEAAAAFREEGARPRHSKEGVAAKLMEIARRWSGEPELDPRHPDDILYDEHGLIK